MFQRAGARCAIVPGGVGGKGVPMVGRVAVCVCVCVFLCVCLCVFLCCVRVCQHFSKVCVRAVSHLPHGTLGIFMPARDWE